MIKTRAMNIFGFFAKVTTRRAGYTFRRDSKRIKKARIYLCDRVIPVNKSTNASKSLLPLSTASRDVQEKAVSSRYREEEFFRRKKQAAI